MVFCAKTNDTDIQYSKFQNGYIYCYFGEFSVRPEKPCFCYLMY